MHKVPETLSGARVIDPDQLCDAVAVLGDGEKVAQAATLLDVLGEVNRLSILLALQHAGDLCVSDLAVAVGMSDSAVSHALRLLRAHGLVTAHRQGRLVRYRLSGGLPRRLLEVVSEVAVAPGPLHAHGHDDVTTDTPDTPDTPES
ncbi:ArsR/SmtB family transcription factor [Pseudonocardia phyllosphaerae]|uniref:ArsR/SmtB family transcription factor n=1 Tax=Pseudonocardia phyllosphaerae TaxID=3390502 RepID=UPI00397AA0A7